MHFLPWWALVACLAASALAAYLLLGRTRAGDSRWALFALTAAAAPALLAVAIATAVVLSILLSTYLEDRTAAPMGRSEPTGAGASPEGTDLETTSGRATPTGSPSAPPDASSAASPSASASP